MLATPSLGNFIIADCQNNVKVFMQFSHKIVEWQKKHVGMVFEII